MPEKVKDKIIRLEKEIEDAYKEQDFLREQLNSFIVKFTHFATTQGMFDSPSEAKSFLKEYTVKNQHSSSHQLKFNFRSKNEKR